MNGGIQAHGLAEAYAAGRARVRQLNREREEQEERGERRGKRGPKQLGLGFEAELRARGKLVCGCGGTKTERQIVCGACWAAAPESAREMLRTGLPGERRAAARVLLEVAAGRRQPGANQFGQAVSLQPGFRKAAGAEARRGASGSPAPGFININPMNHAPANSFSGDDGHRPTLQEGSR